MATVKLGILVSAIAGSVGGGTFQRDAQGTQLRNKPLPKLRRSLYTGTPRGITAYLTQRWRDIDPADQADWDVAASTMTWHNRFGDVITGKGYWLYLRVNHYLWLYNATTTDLYLGVGAIDAFADLACTYEATPKMEVTWSAPAVIGADSALLLFATPRMSLGTSADYGSSRYIGYIPEGEASGYDIYPQWNARFGQTTAVPANVYITAIPFNFGKPTVGPTYGIKAAP
jgi:hypothetical protein